MKTLDIILLIPLFFGAYLGYKKGLLITLIKIVALIGGVIAGFKLIHIASVYLSPYIGNSSTLPIVSFLVVFILVIIGTNLVGKALKKILDMTLLGSLDNLFGAILNLMKWCFGLSILLWLLHQLNVIPIKHTSDTFIYPILLKIAPNIILIGEKTLPFTSDLVDYIHNL